MDSQSFTIGLVCGVVIGALAVWAIGDNGEVEVVSTTDYEAEAPANSEAVTLAPPSTQEPQDLFTEGNQDANNPPSPVETAVDSAAPWPENQRAKLGLEPKDDSWAYYMEQTLLQFLSAHPSIDQFDISSIECRTTKCQIEVFGFDESTVPVWQQVMYDINQQTWSEFGQHGTESGKIDDRLLIVGTLHRKTEQE